MMKRTILILSLLLGHLWQSRAQVMMLFSSDSLTNITSPLDLDSLFYWFAADVGVTDSLGGAIATDEGVGTWNDLSGNGYHVTQTTNGARPVYKATGGSGSKPTIQFDGSNDFLASSAHFWGSDDISIFAVVKFANATRNASEAIVGKWLSTTANRQWLFYGLGSAAFALQFNTSTDGTASASWRAPNNSKHTAWKVHSMLSSGVDADLWTDGASVTAAADVTSTIFDDATEGVSIGALNTSTTPTFFGQISVSEVIVYSRELSATERAAIENYLNKKYDLY